MDVLQRAATKIEILDDGCWEWTAAKDRDGYDSEKRRRRGE